MSDINSNEKNNSGDREKRVNNGSGEAHRNNRNNNHRRYHQKRPYPKNNDKAVSATAETQNTAGTANVANTANAVNDVAKKNNQVHVKPEGNKEFKKHSRPNNFERKRPNHGNVRVEETIQDIDIDIGRIEKEIELEIKEIAAFKFGL